MANELGRGQHGNPGLPTLTCDHMMQNQRGRRYKFLGKSFQRRSASCLSFARHTLSESRSLSVGRKVGGKHHLKLNMCLKQIANKNFERKLAKDFEKRELKVPEIAGKEVSWTSFCLVRLAHDVGIQCLRCCLHCLSEPIHL